MRNKKLKVLNITIVHSADFDAVYVEDKLFYQNNSIMLSELVRQLDGQAFRIIKIMHEDPDEPNSSYEKGTFPENLNDIKEIPKYTQIYPKREVK